MKFLPKVIEHLKKKERSKKLISTGEGLSIRLNGLELEASIGLNYDKPYELVVEISRLEFRHKRERSLKNKSKITLSDFTVRQIPMRKGCECDEEESNDDCNQPVLGMD